MRTRQSGVALIEFALVLPLLLLLMFAVVEFGRAVYQYNTLTKSVRDAARYLSVQTPGTHLAEARNLVVFGNVAGNGAPLVAGLAPSHVPDPVWQLSGTVPVINVVTVQVSGYTFESMFTTVLGHSFGPITFSDITATMRSHL